MKKLVKLIALLLAVVFILSSCGSKTTSRPSLDFEKVEKQQTLSFSSKDSTGIDFSKNSVKKVCEAVNNAKANYVYSDLYNINEVKKRLEFEVSVKKHEFSVLNENGELDAIYMANIVEQNNEAFLKDHDFGYTRVDQDFIVELCEHIIKIVTELKKQYPDIDWERVYCNLGNLKILYNVGMLSYAQVSSDLVLSISKNNTNIILNNEGEDAFARVLTHETVHIVQIGCSCEKIENCSRRAGIAVNWDDFHLNTTDWTWLVEGSAERVMCKLTGGDAISYQYKMDYLCSFNLAILLRDNVKPDTMEALNFYSDPKLLFDAFGCKNEKEREELISAMITMNILQMQPSSFYEVYKDKTGIDPTENDETLNQFSYTLKPAVCVTLAKEFYQNLALFLNSNKVTVCDLLFMISIFEGHLNQHLQYNNESKKEINAPFVEEYLKIRNALFETVNSDNKNLDIASLYSEYNILSGENTLNAKLEMLSPEKREFLIERATWQLDLKALGIKVN